MIPLGWNVVGTIKVRCRAGLDVGNRKMMNSIKKRPQNARSALCPSSFINDEDFCFDIITLRSL